MSSVVVSFSEFKKRSDEKVIFSRWKEYYGAQPHNELLEALVYEHDHDFPLRRSPESMDQLRHKAMVEVLNERAQTDFLKSFLKEIEHSS